MIFIALGSNLPGNFHSSEDVLKAACQALEAQNLRIIKASSIWLTAPVPASNQPWYHNSVVKIKSEESPLNILKIIKKIEKDFGRESLVKNAARILDLDLLVCNDEVSASENLILPHPRMQERGFVLYPLHEVAPKWRHPVLNVTVEEMIEKLPEDQRLDIVENKISKIKVV